MNFSVIDRIALKVFAGIILAEDSKAPVAAVAAKAAKLNSELNRFDSTKDSPEG